MSDELDRILLKINRLLAIAEEPAASQNEADMAFARAQKLKNEYAIMDWQLHAQDRRNDPMVMLRVDLDSGPVDQYKT
ncbi:DUF2786 domain-containing protein, partial [Bifidobacterium xylocopae]